MLAIYGATQGPQHGWASRAAWPYLGSGVVLLAGYVPWALRRPHPAVDLTLLRHAQTALAVGLCALVAVVMFAVLFLLPVFLEELQGLGPPVAAVHGNVDAEELRRRLPEARLVDADGAKIAIVHDAGPAHGRLERMRARFPEADAVVFGHSHIPLHEERGGFQIFNPGSPTDRRRQPRFTMGVAEAENGRIRFELVNLD